jgi:hypothetical protein
MYICAGMYAISIAIIKYDPNFLVAGKISNAAATTSTTPAKIFINIGLEKYGGING